MTDMFMILFSPSPFHINFTLLFIIVRLFTAT